MVEVAAFAASPETSPPAATITATRLFTSSAAKAGNRPKSPRAQRNSTTKFLPSTSSLSLRPLRNAASTLCESSGERLLMNPITGRVPCCARAASGHPAAAPPTSVMNSHRLTSQAPQTEGLTLPCCGLHCASRQILTADVRFGSLADISGCPIDVRFTPKSGRGIGYPGPAVEGLLLMLKRTSGG